MRLLIVDDHEIGRATLRQMLELTTTFEIVAEAGDGLEAVALVEEVQPDIVLMDIQMPFMSGIEATEIIKQRHPNVYVLALTMYGDDASRAAMKRVGADGFVMKGDDMDLIYSLTPSRGDFISH